MSMLSTRGAAAVSESMAILRGLAPDGGLYVPEDFPHFSMEDIAALGALNYQARALAILQKFLPDFTADELKNAIAGAYGAGFDDADIAPVRPVGDWAHVLELWHGPTLAFKDMALQILPYLLTTSAKKTVDGKQIAILVATSGDTGKAALEGFKDVDGTSISVFYPEDGVSKMQKRQMTTQEGKNVNVCAVKGNFDDCQNGVKAIFTDKAIADRLAKNNILLSSANSINWGRLAPQIVYYVSTYAELLKNKEIEYGEKINVVVPTGNFGNILAAYYAKLMGIPVNKLICASNSNNVLTDFINTGVYDRNRKFYTTVSPSMDILISSNLERLLYHVTGSDAEVAGLMKSLAENGSYTVRPETLAAIQETFACGWSSEKEVAGEIRARYEQDGYLCDTHTAVAFHVAAQKKRSGVPMVVLSTASPFKFPRSVLEALGRTAPENDFEAMQQLEAAAGHAAPASLAALRQKAERFNTVIDPAQIAEVALGYQA